MLPSIFTDNIFDDFFGNDFTRSIMDTEKNLTAAMQRTS